MVEPGRPSGHDAARAVAVLEEVLAVALRAADAGAQVALRWRERASQLRIEEKAGPGDLVSQADRETEDAIRAVLTDQRPDDGILGEEHGEVAGRSDVCWLIDPIDGTTSYLYGRSDWAVSVAAADRDGKLLAGVVAEPSAGRLAHARSGAVTCSGGVPVTAARQDDLVRALVEVNLGRPDQRLRAGAMVAALAPRVRDLRRGGSAAAALAGVATGRADAAWLPGLQPWDCAAGVLLVQQAGGVVGDLSSELTAGTWPRSGDVLAAGPGLFEPLRSLLSAVYR